jgi:hypothetical protein
VEVARRTQRLLPLNKSSQPLFAEIGWQTLDGIDNADSLDATVNLESVIDDDGQSFERSARGIAQVILRAVFIRSSSHEIARNSH